MGSIFDVAITLSDMQNASPRVVGYNGMCSCQNDGLLLGMLEMRVCVYIFGHPLHVQKINIPFPAHIRLVAGYTPLFRSLLPRSKTIERSWVESHYIIVVYIWTIIKKRACKIWFVVLMTFHAFQSSQKLRFFLRHNIRLFCSFHCNPF